MPSFFKSTNFFKGALSRFRRDKPNVPMSRHNPFSKVLSNVISSPIHTRRKLKPRGTLRKQSAALTLAKAQENFNKGRKPNLPKIKSTVKSRIVNALGSRKIINPRPFSKARTNKLKKNKTYMALLNRHGMRRKAVL